MQPYTKILLMFLSPHQSPLNTIMTKQKHLLKRKNVNVTKAHLPRLLSLAGWPVLGVLVVPNFFHLSIMEAAVLLGAFDEVK